MTRTTTRHDWLGTLLVGLDPAPKLQLGEWVQVRSGGKPMRLMRIEENGDAVCQLGERTFTIPEPLLRPLGEKPLRRGRKPGVSPQKRSADAPSDRD